MSADLSAKTEGFFSFLTTSVAQSGKMPSYRYSMHSHFFFFSIRYFIHADESMVDPEHKTRALPRNSDLMEELGQVEIVFSDKTGTLTCNKMEFVRGSIAGRVIGPHNNELLEESRLRLRQNQAPPFHLVGDTSPYKRMFEKGKHSS